MDMSEYAVKYADRRRVVCAAVRAEDGEVMIGLRHYCPTMRRLIRSRPDGKKFEGRYGDDQGFVDQWGNFMTREEAWKVAEGQDQIRELHGGETLNGGHLFSENLY